MRASLLLVCHPKDPDRYYLVPSRHGLGPKPNLLAYSIVSHSYHPPTLRWLADAQSHLDALLGKTDPISSKQRQSILHYLQTQPPPQSIDAIISALALDYQPVRKMLQRMTSAGELTSPSRGLYTLSPSPSIPPPTHVPNVPNVPTDPLLQPDSATHVPNVPNVPTIQKNIAYKFLVDDVQPNPLLQPDHAISSFGIPADAVMQTSNASDHLTTHVPNVPNTPAQERSMDNTPLTI